MTAFGAKGNTVGQSSAGFASFNQFVRNPFKRRDDLGNHHPNPGEDDINSCSKREGLNNGEDNKVLTSAQGLLDKGFARNEHQHQKQNHHGERDGHR